MGFQNGLSRWIAVLGALLGAAGVMLAAAASHGEDQRLLGSAAQMALAHAPALVALGLYGLRGRLWSLAAGLMAAGVIVFVGDLLYRHYLGQAAFPMAAPIGGAGMIGGWVLLALAGLTARQ
jgi:uncharacterized membrane protein YgdD (TMEM256/DUF423 family)